METKSKRIYPCQQLVVALDAQSLKLFIYICNWQSQGAMKYYPNTLAKAMKCDEDELELTVQTLADAKLINISKIDQTFMIEPNAEQCQKYFNIPIKDVIDGKGIRRATHVTWNCNESSPSKGDIEDMSEEQIQKMIMRLQVSLNEKKQMKKVVQTCEPNYEDDLPF